MSGSSGKGKADEVAANGDKDAMKESCSLPVVGVMGKHRFRANLLQRCHSRVCIGMLRRVGRQLVIRIV